MIYPVALKSLDATPALERRRFVIPPKLPFLNSLVQAATDDFMGVRGECNARDTVRMAFEML